MITRSHQECTVKASSRPLHRVARDISRSPRAANIVWSRDNCSSLDQINSRYGVQKPEARQNPPTLARSLTLPFTTKLSVTSPTPGLGTWFDDIPDEAENIYEEAYYIVRIPDKLHVVADELSRSPPHWTVPSGKQN